MDNKTALDIASEQLYHHILESGITAGLMAHIRGNMGALVEVEKQELMQKIHQQRHIPVVDEQTVQQATQEIIDIATDTGWEGRSAWQVRQEIEEQIRKVISLGIEQGLQTARAISQENQNYETNNIRL